LFLRPFLPGLPWRRRPRSAPEPPNHDHEQRIVRDGFMAAPQKPAAAPAVSSTQTQAQTAVITAAQPSPDQVTAEAAPAPTLFLVVLGGSIGGAHIELHDVRFVLGASIDDTLPALRRQWFGARKGLHLDSWMAVRFVDGYRVELRPEPFAGPERLWFVNMGGYDPQQLAELHAFGLVVATSPQAAKAAARRRFLPAALERHKDDLHGVEAALTDGVDDCLEVQLSLGADPADRWTLHLIPDGREQPQVPDWFGYRLI
jgi:hypothetical protein